MSNASPEPSLCSEPLLFSFNDLGSRQVIADFSAGYLSSDGGMLFLRQIDEGLGISRSLARCFYDARNPLLIEHSVRELVASVCWAWRQGTRISMIIIFCGSIRSLPRLSVKRIRLEAGALPRIKARRWPALRH